jgi:hypothetical protein
LIPRREVAGIEAQNIPPPSSFVMAMSGGILA